MAPLSRALLTLPLAVVVTGAAVTAGVVLRSPTPTHTTAPRPAARLASIDTTTAAVRRGAFCADVPRAAVQAAVGEASPETASWSNGDPLPSGHDVAHEFGCSWTARSGTVGSAWVFAPPVTVQRGQELVASARAQHGCRPLPGAAAFGSPSVALSCAAGGTTTLSYRGLFGDAWLVCQLAGSQATDPADVVDRWCASVLTVAAPSAG